MAKETPKLHAVDDPIAPVTVGNPEAASALAIDQTHLEEFVTAGSKSTVVECRRPAKAQFFTVRPETGKPWKDRRFYWLLQLEGRDPYIVAPTIANKRRGGRHDPPRADRPLCHDGRRGRLVAAQDRSAGRQGKCVE